MTMIFAEKHFHKAAGFFNMFFHRLPDGFFLHSHDYLEIVIVIEGMALHRINGKCYDVSPGDVYVLQGNTVHGFEKASHDFMVANVMYLKEKMRLPLNDLQKMPGYRALFMPSSAKLPDDAYKERLSLSPLELNAILLHLREMRDELDSIKPGFESIFLAQLIWLTVFLARSYASTTASNMKGVSEKIGKIILWLTVNCEKNVSISEMAEMAGLSRRHFTREFRKTTGQSLGEYLSGLRMRRACELLRKGGRSISEVALACGFQDGNYFSRKFKEFAGYAPCDYTQHAK